MPAPLGAPLYRGNGKGYQMHIADTLAGLLTMARFTPRPIADGTEYSARVIGAADGGTICPDGARVLRFTIDATGRWLAMVDPWGKVEADCDLRTYSDAGSAWRTVAGQAWPAIAERLANARDESAAQDELCRAVAGMAKGKARRTYCALASDHLRAALTCADAIDGPLSADIAALSDDDLLAELTA